MQRAASDFLSPNNFKAQAFSNEEASRQKYEKELARFKECAYITIGENDVWGARGLDGSDISSYEKIGYHTGSYETLKAMLDSGVRLLVYRSGAALPIPIVHGWENKYNNVKFENIGLSDRSFKVTNEGELYPQGWIYDNICAVGKGIWTMKDSRREKDNVDRLIEWGNEWKMALDYLLS